MGKELKRVPINFEWEIGKTWCGYINPHEVHKCKNCDGSGYSDEYYKLRDEWYGDPTKENYIPNPFRKNCIYNTKAWKNNLNEDDVNALLENDRLWDFTRVPINDEQKEIVKQEIANGKNSWLPFNNGYIPTPQEVNEWNLKTLGHDSMNAWYCIKARLKKEGKPYVCNKCNGTGKNWQHPKAKKLYNNWKNYDPPIGEGFQLWSYDSPVTPVFNSLEELCDYCEKQNISVFAGNTATKKEWLEMLNDNFVHHKDGNMIFY